MDVSYLCTEFSRYPPPCTAIHSDTKTATHLNFAAKGRCKTLGSELAFMIFHCNISWPWSANESRKFLVEHGARSTKQDCPVSKIKDPLFRLSYQEGNKIYICHVPLLACRSYSQRWLSHDSPHARPPTMNPVVSRVTTALLVSRITSLVPTLADPVLLIIAAIGLLLSTVPHPLAVTEILAVGLHELVGFSACEARQDIFGYSVVLSDAW